MRKIVMVAAAAAMTTAAPAYAQSTDSADMEVTATIEDSCTITAGSMAFGLVDLTTGTDHDTSATITLSCTNGAGYSVAMGNGNNYASGSHNLSDGTDVIPYDIYSDSARVSVWEGATEVTGTAGADDVELVAYGRIPSTAGNVPAGDYSDTVSVTVTF